MRTHTVEGIRYEMTSKKLVKRSAIAKFTNDITKLSTRQIFMRLYRRHELIFWQTVTGMLLAFMLVAYWQ